MSKLVHLLLRLFGFRQKEPMSPQTIIIVAFSMWILLTLLYLHMSQQVIPQLVSLYYY